MERRRAGLELDRSIVVGAGFFILPLAGKQGRRDECSRRRSEAGNGSRRRSALRPL